MNTLPLRALFLLAVGNTFSWGADQMPTASEMREVLLTPVDVFFSDPYRPVKSLYFDLNTWGDIEIYEALSKAGWTVYQPVEPFVTQSVKESQIFELHSDPSCGPIGYRSRFYLKINEGGMWPFFSIIDLSTSKIIAMVVVYSRENGVFPATILKTLDKCIQRVGQTTLKVSGDNFYIIFDKKLSWEEAVVRMQSFCEKYNGLATLCIEIPTSSLDPEQLKRMDEYINKSGGSRPATPSEAQLLKERIEALNLNIQVKISGIVVDSSQSSRRRIALATERE